MCGIAGLAVLDGGTPPRADLERMAGSLARRGPDAEGYLTVGAVGLAHRRLRIIDLTPLGDQPMQTPDGRVAVTFNGEIYNFLELRRLLEQDAFAFRGHSDTEVLLNGYLRWGIRGLLDRIDGMFAFGLLDARLGQLFLCRDRFGKKPLYYYASKARVRFASEIRPLWESEPGLSLDLDSIDYYLAELSVPQPRTIWKEIRQVPPSQYLTVDLRSGEHHLDRYWTLEFDSGALPIEADEAERELERLVRTAVARRTISDVPIGAFLSGGVDSGLVVACLAQQLGPGVRTFTVTLEGAEGDETQLAREVAARYATDHREIHIEPTLVDDLPEMAAYFGEPFGDASAVPSYYVSRAIGSQVKVALSGDGGDEMFGGYHDYAWAHLTDEYDRTSSLRGTRGRLQVLANKAGHRLGLTDVNLGHYEAYARLEGWERLHRQMGFSPREGDVRGAAFEGTPQQPFAVRHLESVWNRNLRPTLADTLAQASLETRLLNDYLVKVDRASMMCSLEVRSPFLDRALAEFAARLPATVKFGQGRPKHLLRRLASRLVAGDSYERPKRGFGIPVAAWLRGKLREFATTSLLSGPLRASGLVRAEVVERLLREHLEERADHADRIWCLLMLDLWLARYRP